MNAAGVQSDIFDDPDLLDFEDPRTRDVAAAKFRTGRNPATITAARGVMFVQPVLPIVLPIVVGILGGGRGSDADGSAAVTTTTVAAEESTRRGGGGAFLLFFLGFLVLVGLILVPAVKLKRPTPGLRNFAVVVEAFVLLLGIGALSRGVSVTSVVLASSAAAVVALLLSPASRRALSASTQAETTARFDVRNLPEFDR